MSMNHPLRGLMDTYLERLEKIKADEKEAKADGDTEAEIIGEALRKQMNVVISDLFKKMAAMGVLDDEEIEMGLVKKT